MSELSERLIPPPLKGSRALSSGSVPPESIVGEARCQPRAINHPLSEGGRQGGDPPPQDRGVEVLMPSPPPEALRGYRREHDSWSGH